MSTIVWLLAGEALHARDHLRLDAGARLRCRSERIIRAMCATAATLPNGYVPLAGFTYRELGISIPLELGRCERATHAIDTRIGA
ncbi:MAG: hypothetical protein VX766_03495 [Pseudomonadota bacterium]|nr:hypothetical protein [Pseudomonadota bacterium]